MGIRFVIPTSGRSGTASTPHMLPEWVEIAVRESESDAYSQSFPNPQIILADDKVTLGTVRNAVLDAVDDETVVMFDDDLNVLYCLTDEKTRRFDDPDEVAAVVANCAIMARDAGASFFGFSQRDIRQYKASEPFRPNTWVGGVVGINGRKFRFAEGRSRVDIDYTLQCLLVDRITWQDARYWFSQKRDTNTGGSSQHRDAKSDKDDIEYLVQKWPGFVKLPNNHRSKVSISLNVRRRQDVDY